MSSRRFVLCALLVAAGCDVGDVTGIPLPDAGDEAPAVDADPTAPDAEAATFTCRDTVAGVGGGEHNAGQACIACHAGNGGPDYTLAGTLYADTAGTIPLAGATIVAIDATGAELELVTQQNGNFWTEQPVTFPVRVAATRCPDVTPMIGAITSGDCNAGGCHVAGGGAGRVHLP